MACPDFGLSYTVGECNDDGTRTVTFTFTNYPASPTVEVSADYETDGVIDDGPVVVLGGTTAAFTNDYAGGATYTATFTATMPDGTTCTVTRTIDVPGCCDVQITVAAGDCNGDGTRASTIVVENDGTVDVDIELDYGDYSATTTDTITAGSTKIYSHDYPASTAATYTITVTITDPTGCDPVTATIDIDACDEPDTDVPEVVLNTVQGDCDSDGKRSVDISATVTAASSSDTVEAELWIDGSRVDTQTGTGSVVLSWSDTVAGGTTLTVRVVILAPTASETTQSVTIADCTCPEITFSYELGDCDETTGERQVTVSATLVSPDSSQALRARLRINGAVATTDTGTGTLILSSSGSYATGSTLSVSVVVVRPSGCDGASDSYEVPPCDGQDDDDDGNDNDDSDDDDDGGSSACGALCAVWAVMVCAYLMGWATGAFAVPIIGPIAAAIATAIMVLFTALYVWLCGLCPYLRCTLVGIAGFAGVVIILLLFGVALPGLLVAGAIALTMLVGALVLRAIFCDSLL